MAVKKQAHKKSGKGSSNGGSKLFQLVNGVITKDDITPLAKSSQNSAMNSDDESSTSTTMESDLLFSPIGSVVDDAEDEDEYDHELLNPVYFGATYPKRFHHVSNAHDDSIVESRKDSVCQQFLKDLLGNPTNDDFWKEVGTTNEEAIFASQPSEPPVESPSVQDQSTTSLDEFIKEDATAPSTSTLSTAQWDDNYKIKLLCYRDTTGNLRLRTQEENCKGSRTAVMGCANHRINKIRKGNKSKLLKNAIRRKSGVREMVSTGVGIGEFML
ncbi:hypothetical protein HG537_0B01780 [Torulaspora globosa]|uniref:Uncharacterized protein n=1 Tax=Torulaspora globosa TaxID=48254 RepID=A0A7H9HNE4_9SACH|nr:hypothetical protein HG537_0B01780 [Torulaspora sp. CBS 2947]